MSSHSSGRSRRKKKKDDPFVQTKKRSSALPIFLLTLGGLLAATAFWAATRDRSRPIPVDTSDGGQKSIASIQATKSWKRLETACDDIQQRMTGQSPSEVRDLLKVYRALAERQIELATTDDKKTEAQAKQLTALRSLATTEQELGLRLKLATELSAIGLKLTEHPDNNLASQAFQSLFVASDLILADGLNDEEDASRLSVLLGTWVEQAASRFPTEQPICDTIGMLFTRYPNVKDRDKQLQQLVEVVQKGYGNSPSRAIVDWASRVEIKQFFDENKVLSLLEAALTQTKMQPDQLQVLEEQLFADKPTIGKLQFAVQLAQIYEGFDEPKAMQRLLDRITALDLSGIMEDKRQQLLSDIQKMAERQVLRGQKLETDLVLRDGTQVTAQSLNEQVALLVFFSVPAELEKLEYQMGLLERLPKSKFQYFIAGPPISEEEWIRLSLLARPGEPEFRLPLLEAKNAEQLRARFRITSTVFPVTCDKGLITSLGTPLSRALLWLESRLYSE
jgi:hypothetical protein